MSEHGSRIQCSESILLLGRHKLNRAPGHCQRLVTYPFLLAVHLSATAWLLGDSMRSLHGLNEDWSSSSRSCRDMTVFSARLQGNNTAACSPGCPQGTTRLPRPRCPSSLRPSPTLTPRLTPSSTPGLTAPTTSTPRLGIVLAHNDIPDLQAPTNNLSKVQSILS